MAIIMRLSRLFRADFNAVLDHIEEPELLFKQALLDMQESINNDKGVLKQLLSNHLKTQEKIENGNSLLLQIDNELEICFESEKLDLAKQQVKKKVELQRYIQLLQSDYSSITSEISEYEKRIQENESRHTNMQQKLELFDNQNNTSLFDSNSFSDFNVSVNVDDLEMAFLREKKERGML